MITATELVRIWNHTPIPQADTTYCLDWGVGIRGDVRNRWRYPMSAHCLTCGTMIECPELGAPWEHTGRAPGAPVDWHPIHSILRELRRTWGDHVSFTPAPGGAIKFTFTHPHGGATVVTTGNPETCVVLIDYAEQ